MARGAVVLLSSSLVLSAGALAVLNRSGEDFSLSADDEDLSNWMTSPYELRLYFGI